VPLYELEEGTSRKFYRIELHGNRVHLHWGRIGTEGEHQILAHENEAAARAEYQRQLDKRLERGYRLVVDEGVPHDPEALEKARLAKTGELSASPRFLFVHRRRRRFAWVEARDHVVLHAEGPAADEAKTEPTRRACTSPAVAIRERDALVGALIAKGYELETFGKKEPPKSRARKPIIIGEEVERAVVEDPYDEDAWAVLEDWILQQEDPRAELVRLAKANERGDEAQARGAALPQLLGPKHAALAHAFYPATWRAGYIVECRYTEPARNADAVSESFYRSPAMRLVRKLDLYVDGLARFAAQLPLIATSPCARSLRHLGVESARDAEHTPIGHLEALSNLVSLRIHAPQSLLESGPPPALRELSIALATPESIATWCRATFPLLTTLHLRFMARPELARALAPLLERAMAPALHSLVIHVRSRECADAVRTLVEPSPLRAQLRVLAIEAL
jgi:uncharacterized protein (TIGR02996 family)